MPTELRPVLNPVLSFKRDPRRVGVTGRSAQENQVVVLRLEQQRAKLSGQILALENQSTRQHAGKLLVAVKMFDDSLAPTYEPESIFRETLGSELIAPIEGGYLAQVDQRAIKNLSAIVQNGTTTDVRVTVSRIEDIGTPTEADVLRGRTVQSLWEHAIREDRGRVFTLWLAPYRENQARTEVANQIGASQRGRTFFPFRILWPSRGNRDQVPTNCKSKIARLPEASFVQSESTGRTPSRGCNS